MRVARRSAHDGASCADPFVVEADAAEGYGDTRSGRIEVVDDESAASRRDPPRCRHPPGWHYLYVAFRRR